MLFLTAPVTRGADGEYGILGGEESMPSEGRSVRRVSLAFRRPYCSGVGRVSRRAGSGRRAEILYGETEGMFRFFVTAG